MPVEIRLVREKIKIEEQSAKKKIIEIKEDGKTYKIGVIDLPRSILTLKGNEKEKKTIKAPLTMLKR